MAGKVKLTEAQREALNELSAIEGDGWIKTRWLSGSAEARSSKNLNSLAALNCVESKRWGDNKQSQYIWRITPAGRAHLASSGRDD